ncbi:hypothetical protein [Leptospira weilii]|uniref:Uncharacterized protein n=1 Tax=Leptospira weilii str. UI 13098 TaxID=1088542 RepID=M6QFD1_9LEPT|nr:hypothetical protein [Leptospira weilii]EMN91213.1 hypothetical protein LEP1GSC108_3296 [Leptospira weilii str. UI 13098]
MANAKKKAVKKKTAKKSTKKSTSGKKIPSANVVSSSNSGVAVDMTPKSSETKE